MNVADVKQTNPLSQIDFKPLAPSVSQQIQAPAITGTDKAVTMAFTAQTWVSVTDKSGSVVYEKMSHNGDVEAINAPLPLNLVIGNASATKLNVGGKDVDLAPNTKNNVARITLE
jgi:cytoskeleton protein RodZ